MYYNRIRGIMIYITLEVKKMAELTTGEKWIGLNDAADFFGVKPSTIRAWIRNGKGVPCIKIGKAWKFKYSELDAWAKSCKADSLSLSKDNQ